MAQIATSWQETHDEDGADSSAREKRRRQNRESQRRFRERHRVKASHPVTAFPPVASPASPPRRLLTSTDSLEPVGQDGEGASAQCRGGVHSLLKFGAGDFSLNTPVWEESGNLGTPCSLTDAGYMALQPASSRRLRNSHRQRQNQSGGLDSQHTSITGQHQSHHLHQMPMAVVNPLINFGDAHPDLDTIGGNQYQQPQQRRRRHAHGGGGRSAIDSRQAKRRYEPAPSLSPGDFLPSDAPLRGAHEAPLLGISETGPVSSCLVNHQQWPDNINKAAAAGVFAPLGTSGSGSHDSASSRPRTQSCRKEKQRQQQQPSRAESIIRDFKRLYEFGVDVGVLPEDHDMAAGLGRMEAHFRSLSRRATDGGDGGSSPVQGHWDSDSDASSASGLGSGVSGAEGLEEDF